MGPVRNFESPKNKQLLFRVHSPRNATKFSEVRQNSCSAQFLHGVQLCQGERRSVLLLLPVATHSGTSSSQGPSNRLGRAHRKLLRARYRQTISPGIMNENQESSAQKCLS